MVVMPGTSFDGAAPPLSDEESMLAARLAATINTLAVDIGERNVTRKPEALEMAASFLTRELEAIGFTVVLHPYEARHFRAAEAAEIGDFASPRRVVNLVAELRGTTRPTEIVVVGAHYDTAHYTPGADDNASGVAVNLELARALFQKKHPRTIRFVFFTNEEPPWFEGVHMGSEVYARECRARGDDVVAMIALETMAFFRSEPKTQHYPWPFSALYPSSGSFIGFVGDVASQGLVSDAVKQFRAVATIPSEGAALPADIEGIDWSDHGPFWRHDYRALMVTDTAPFRNPHYHEDTDLPGTLDVEKLTRTAVGLGHVLTHVATTEDRW
jgi:Zn-dependent M28 family amino/carboxypeptidase